MAVATGFYEGWASLYDRMIDWDRRLSVEGPALASFLRSADAGRVLDIACGTGRHLAWLAAAGFDVAGADASPAMAARARQTLAPGRSAAVVEWSMADPVPAELAKAGPFASAICLGNSFPHLLGDAEVSASLVNFRSLLKPGGRLLIGLKALGVMQAAGEWMLPLVRRGDDEHPLLFVRFYDFESAPAGSADFHLVIVGQDHPALAPGGVHHVTNRLRAWWPGQLTAFLIDAGYTRVQVWSDLSGRPWRGAEDGHDVFIAAQRGE